MIKCFLSHSSRDKAGYVDIVVRHLRLDGLHYDQLTFESGMQAGEEIIRGLDDTSLFVLFISEHALESDWVKAELREAKARFDRQKLQRIYPILIDASIAHTDPRIPQWMRDTANLQHVRQPTVAARRINARLLELTWTTHPQLRERAQLFVGRNALIRDIEQRLDDYQSTYPGALIASGLPAVGRRSLLRHAMQKANLVRDSYSFPMISLSAQDSIEDFILKLDSLGLAAPISRRDVLAADVSGKIATATNLASEFVRLRERILIEDNGAIVLAGGHVVDWFLAIVRALAPSAFLVFSIASRLKPNRTINKAHPQLFVTHVPELDETERAGLLSRYLQLRECSLSHEDFAFVADLLTGYPEQVFYAVELLADQGIRALKKQSHDIQQYSAEKARIIVDELANDQEAQDLLYFLSRFEFVSYDVLFSIAPEPKIGATLEKFLSRSVCERLGTSVEYIRVSDVVRDYISRGRFGFPKQYELPMRQHVEHFIKTFDGENTDISDYMFSAKEALLQGQSLPDDLLIPSIFLRTIRTLYDEKRNYAAALDLCSRALKRQAVFHREAVNHIRYIKCRCHARLRQGDELFRELKLLDEPDVSFLKGFYFRLSGDFEKAEASLKRALEVRPRDPRATGELVIIYLQTDEHELAFELAKANYRNRPNNSTNAFGYFACLVHREKSSENKAELESLIAALERDPSDRAQEMATSAKARFLAMYSQDWATAFRLLDDKIAVMSDPVYPLLTKADLAMSRHDIPRMRDAITALGAKVKKGAQTYRQFIRLKAMFLTMTGQPGQGRELIETEMRGFSQRSLKVIFARLSELEKKAS